MVIDDEKGLVGHSVTVISLMVEGLNVSSKPRDCQLTSQISVFTETVGRWAKDVVQEADESDDGRVVVAKVIVQVPANELLSSTTNGMSSGMFNSRRLRTRPPWPRRTT